MTEKQYGIVNPAEQARLSGLDFVQSLVNGALPHNSMARTLGYDIVEAAPGRVVVTATPTAELLNPAGTVHGGFSATLLDTCMGLAVLTTVDKGFGSTTLEFKISFVRPIMPETGLLRAEGTVVSGGRRVGTAEGRLTDAAGRLLVHATTTCLIFERPAGR
jgi:uncharacterized protein (TIGR00369 family)